MKSFENVGFQFQEDLPYARSLKLAAALSEAALTGAGEITADPTPLPEPYQYADSGSITSPEAAALFRQVEIGREVEDDFLDTIRADSTACGDSLLEVGVKSPEGDLVGYGAIRYDACGGELGNLVVSPAHQGKGIGKALVTERLRLADEHGIAPLTIPYFEPTNTIVAFYAVHGFVPQVGGGYRRAGVGRWRHGASS